MNYYRIRHSLDKEKVLGHSSQVKEVKHNCNVDQESRFIMHFHLEKITIDPIVSTPVLYAKSKKTDLIERLGMGFSYRLLISGRLKTLLTKYRKDGFQYFQCPIFHKGIKDEDYWIMNVYETNEEYIDYEKSEAVLRSRKSEGGTQLSPFKISSLSEFHINREYHKKNNTFLFIKRIVLKKQVVEEFFVLNHIEGGVGYFVSERLKQEIEEAGCTGIEFQPAHLSYDEWVVRGGERDKVYGRP